MVEPISDSHIAVDIQHGKFHPKWLQSGKDASNYKEVFIRGKVGQC